jgi:hypothetical protein
MKKWMIRAKFDKSLVPKDGFIMWEHHLDLKNMQPFSRQKAQQKGR